MTAPSCLARQEQPATTHNYGELARCKLTSPSAGVDEGPVRPERQPDPHSDGSGKARTVDAAGRLALVPASTRADVKPYIAAAARRRHYRAAGRRTYEARCAACGQHLRRALSSLLLRRKRECPAGMRVTALSVIALRGRVGPGRSARSTHKQAATAGGPRTPGTRRSTPATIPLAAFEREVRFGGWRESPSPRAHRALLELEARPLVGERCFRRLDSASGLRWATHSECAWRNIMGAAGATLPLRPRARRPSAAAGCLSCGIRMNGRSRHAAADPRAGYVACGARMQAAQRTAAADLPLSSAPAEL